MTKRQRRLPAMSFLAAWLAYAPSGFRKAWCEITGGHDNIVCKAMAGKFDRRLVTHVQLVCRRCVRTTRWHPIPSRKPLHETRATQAGAKPSEEIVADMQNRKAPGGR
jgi:hypothetical protein